MILAVLPDGSQLTRGSFGTSDETVPAACRTDEVVQFSPEGYAG